MKTEQSVDLARLYQILEEFEQITIAADRELGRRLGLPGQTLLLAAYDPECSAHIKTEPLSLPLGTALVKQLDRRAREMARKGRIPADRAKSIVVHAALARFLADPSHA